MKEIQSESSGTSGATRRHFLEVSAGLLGFFVSLVVGIPFIGALISTKFRKEKGVWNRTVDVGSLQEGQPVRLNFEYRTEDAYLTDFTVHSVWAIKHSESAITVFSPICTHLGCYYKWNAGDNHFECPCHQSIFSIDGKVLGGPAPRPLDTLPLKIEDGVLYVQWQEFKVGITEKKMVG